jgi:hypothetical protein
MMTAYARLVGGTGRSYAKAGFLQVNCPPWAPIFFSAALAKKETAATDVSPRRNHGVFYFRIRMDFSADGIIIPRPWANREADCVERANEQLA